MDEERRPKNILNYKRNGKRNVEPQHFAAKSSRGWNGLEIEYHECDDDNDEELMTKKFLIRYPFEKKKAKKTEVNVEGGICWMACGKGRWKTKIESTVNYGKIKLSVDWGYLWVRRKVLLK